MDRGGVVRVVGVVGAGGVGGSGVGWFGWLGWVGGWGIITLGVYQPNNQQTHQPTLPQNIRKTGGWCGSAWVGKGHE